MSVNVRSLGETGKNVVHELLAWLTSHLPSFSEHANPELRRWNVEIYARGSFLFAVLAICIIVPIWNVISLKKRVFRVTHYLRHEVFKSHRWIHESPFYHNQSFHLFLFWSVVVFITTFHGCDRDLLQITKRMGRISVALMPPLLFLTLRPSPLPETLYLTLVPIHKWISRVVVIESFLHSILYVWYMVRNHALMKLKKLANIYGVLAMILFILIGVTSIMQARRRNYRLFYYVHYIGTWLCVVMIHFHARPGVPYYTFMNCTILLWQIVYRVLHTRLTVITAVKISPSLTLVEFPEADLSIKPVLPAGHVRINKYYNNWLQRWFFFLVPLQHPYTVASLPSDKIVRLVVRNGRFPLVSNEKYYVTGIFKPRLTFMRKQDFLRSNGENKKSLFSFLSLTKKNEFCNPLSGPISLSPLSFNVNIRRVLMCVGGSAISFALPILRILKYNGVNVRLIWVSRDITDLELLNHFKFNFDGMQIYISGLSGSENEIQIDYFDGHSGPQDQQIKYMLLPKSRNTLESEELPYQCCSHTDDNSPLLPKCPIDIDCKRINSGDYGTLRKAGSLGCLRNVGHIDPNDEIDFTQEYSFRKHKSSKSQDNLRGQYTQKSAGSFDMKVFREPAIIESAVCMQPNQDHTVANSQNGAQQPNVKLQIPSGIQVFCGRPTLDDSDYAWCLERECDVANESDDNCQLTDQRNTDTDALANVVVIAAGPPGLVEATRRFATDGGLHFHEEAFAL